MAIPYEQYDKMSKGRIAAYNYKETRSSKESRSSSKEVKGPTRRTKSKRATQKKKPSKKAETGMIVGKKYFIENNTRSGVAKREVFTGTYQGFEMIGNDVYLQFSNGEILVAPFGIRPAPNGFSASSHRFIEQ